MATSIVTSGSLPRNRSFLSVGQVAQRFDVHPNTVRKHADSGTLRTYRINGGHRRFSEDDVLTWLGLSVERTDETGTHPSANTVPLALVARVSSDKQARVSGENANGSSLDHQIERVETFAREKWGAEPVKRAGKYYETGSGLNFERPRLIALVNDVLAGKYKGGFLVAHDITRIARFGRPLFELICEIGGCEIVYVMKEGEGEEGDGFVEGITEDIISIMTHYTAKYSGLKSAKVCTIPVEPDDLSRMWELFCDGYGIPTITKMLAEEGRKDPKNGKPYGKHVIDKAIKQSEEVLTATVGRSPNRFEQFAETHVEVTGNETDHLEFLPVLQAYLDWEDQHPVSKRVVQDTMIGIQRDTGFTQTKVKVGDVLRKVYRGLRLRQG